jgi:hypothetical protein
MTTVGGAVVCGRYDVDTAGVEDEVCVGTEGDCAGSARGGDVGGGGNPEVFFHVSSNKFCLRTRQ